MTLTHTVTGTAEYATVTADSVTVTIADDDTAGVTVSKTELGIDEGAERHLHGRTGYRAHRMTWRSP